MRAAWWWIDRWRKSTAYSDMTAEEQGVYRNLLDELWLRDGSLPFSDKSLAQISGDYEAWQRVKKVVLGRFYRGPVGWRNKTHDGVQKEAQRRADKQKAYRDRLKSGNDAGNGGGNGGGNADGTPSPSPSKTPTPKKKASAADAAWFKQAWNAGTNGLPKIARLGPPRVRAIAGFFKAANGDRAVIAKAIQAFGRWGFANEKHLGPDTFLRAKSRDKHLEWAESGPPKGTAESILTDLELT